MASGKPQVRLPSRHVQPSISANKVQEMAGPYALPIAIMPFVYKDFD